MLPPIDLVSYDAGEVVTIPVGYWHAVRNLEHTISVNESMLFPEDLPEVRFFFFLFLFVCAAAILYCLLPYSLSDSASIEGDGW